MYEPWVCSSFEKLDNDASKKIVCWIWKEAALFVLQLYLCYINKHRCIKERELVAHRLLFFRCLFLCPFVVPLKCLHILCIIISMFTKLCAYCDVFQGGKRIVSVACGQTSSMALVENGEVRIFGLFLTFIALSDTQENFSSSGLNHDSFTSCCT